MRLLVMIISILTASCSATNASNPLLTSQRVLEPIHQSAYFDNQLAVDVTSTGCTNEQSFEIDTFALTGHCKVSIYRVKPDFCKRMPHTITLSFVPEFVSNCDQIVVTNPRINTQSATK